MVNSALFEMTQTVSPVPRARHLAAIAHGPGNLLQVFGVDEQLTGSAPYPRYRHCESFDLRDAAYYLYIIGITEAKNRYAEMLEREGLGRLLREYTDQPIRLLLMRSGLNN